MLTEQIHNPNFKPIEFDRFKAESGDNAFTLTPQQWIKATDAVKEFLITPTLSPQEMAYTYASEADILNMALFGKTAAQWRNEKEIKGKTPNIRDFASAEELVVLINLEDTNADLIRQEVPKIERKANTATNTIHKLGYKTGNTKACLVSFFVENKGFARCCKQDRQEKLTILLYTEWKSWMMSLTGFFFD